MRLIDADELKIGKAVDTYISYQPPPVVSELTINNNGYLNYNIKEGGE